MARRWWWSFTGLVPVAVVVPLLATGAYGAAIGVGLGSGLCVTILHLARGQGVTTLDALLLALGAANAVLYLGFGERLLLDHLDAAIYAVLAVQAAASLRTETPWTVQFARRSVAPDVARHDVFRAVNRTVTAWWAAGFGACDAIALAAPWPLRLYLPLGVLAALAGATPPLVRARRSAAGQAA